MAAPFTRADLSRGPGFVTFNGATLFLRGDLDTKHAPVFKPVTSSLHGQTDKYKTDLVIQNTLSVFGLWRDLSVLFPSYILNPVPGASVFSSSDLPMVIQARNNDKITYPNTRITGLMNLHLGTDEELFSGTLQMTSLIAGGANPEDAGAYFVRATATYAAPTLDLTAFVKARWSAAWAGKTGLTSFVGQKGFDISWSFSPKPVPVEGFGTVDMTVPEEGMVASCKCIPIGPTGAQTDTAQAVHAAMGTLLSAGGADLTLAAGTNAIVLKGAGLVSSSTVFGVEPLRNGEAVWETTRGFTTNVPNAVATVS